MFKMIRMLSLLVTAVVSLGTSNAFVFQVPALTFTGPAHRSIRSSTSSTTGRLFTDTVNSNSHMQESELKIEELVDEAVYSASVSDDSGVLDNSDADLLIDEEDELDAQTLMDRKHMELAIQMAKSKSVQLSSILLCLYSNMRIR